MKPPVAFNLKSSSKTSLQDSKINKCIDYRQFSDRIRRTLYYGNRSTLDAPTLPLTGLIVKRFSKLCKQNCLDKLELYRASSVCYDACVTPSSVFLAFMYLDRLYRNNPDYLESTSASQVFVVAMMVASKYLYDDGEDHEVFNDEWANSASILLSDLNDAELNFLFAIDWDIGVTSQEFLSVLKSVEFEIAKQQALARSYYTYSDLLVICDAMNKELTNLINRVGQLFMACILSYTAAISSLIIGTIMANEFSTIITTTFNRMDNHTRKTDYNILPEKTIDYSQHSIDIEIPILEPNYTVNNSESDYRPINAWLNQGVLEMNCKTELCGQGNQPPPIELQPMDIFIINYRLGNETTIDKRALKNKFNLDIDDFHIKNTGLQIVFQKFDKIYSYLVNVIT